MLKKIDNIIGKLTGVVAAVSVAGFTALMLIICCDITKRLITGEAMLGVYEIVERLMMVAVFTSFAYTQFKKGHVRVTMLVNLFPQKLQFLVYGITCLFSFALSGLLSAAVVEQVQYSYTAGTQTGVLFIPLWPFFIVEAVAFGIYALTVLWDAVKAFWAMGNQQVAEHVKSYIGG